MAFKPKTLTRGAVLSQEGVNLIEKIVLRMHSRWSPTIALDLGLDGIIELCDPATHEPLNLVLHVQSKATDKLFDHETGTSFEYRCTERDVVYWLRGNARVILAVSRPSTDEAYWADIRTAFAEPSLRATRKITFDKVRDAFTADAFPKLLDLARPRDSGIYLAPLPKSERLTSNLLRVATVAPRLYVAESPFRERADLWEVLHQKDEEPGGEWLLKDKRIYSFHDLREYPWTEVCDRGTVDDFAIDEWAQSDDRERQRDFVYLLNRALTSKLLPDVRWWNELHCYAFAAPPNLATATASGGTGSKRRWKHRYQSRARQSSLAFFSAYSRKDGEPSHYRHLGFEGHFRRHSGCWYLEVNPTYVFTYDGYRLSRFHSAYLAGIKRRERNRSVVSQLLLLAEHLSTNGTLFDPPYPYLTFGNLLDFDLGVGVDDNAWMSQEEPDEAEILNQEQQIRLFADDENAKV